MSADAYPARLISLDVFRGITIAAMILVNNPGTSPVYWPLDHAEWNGLTPTDWIFPFFLFIVGVAIPLALRNSGRNLAGRESHANERPTRETYIKIISRSVSIYLLGLAISVLPFFQFSATNAPDALKMAIWLIWAAALLFLLLRNFKVACILGAIAFFGVAIMNLGGYTVVTYDFSTMRVLGVLQRIAICYLAASLIYLHTSWKQQVYLSIGLLLLYWFLITSVPVPGCEATSMNDKACNLAAYLDRLIIGENHIWRFGKVYDPEGLLSTIPAIVTAISGVLTGTWLLRRDGLQPVNDETQPSTLVTRQSSLNGILVFGCMLFALGWIWNSFFPFNKALWTSSYVLVTTGLALLLFGCCYWLIDIKGYKKWSWPFTVFGANALALFVFSGLFARMMSAYRVAYTSEGKGISVQKWLVENVFLSIFEPTNASLAYAISFILFWLFLMWLLYRRRVYVKV